MPDSKPDNQWNDAGFDALNVKIKKPFDLPLTATIGRQDIILGDGWLVLEGTPLDGSTTIYFDAARFTLDLKDIQTTVDGIYIYQFGDPDVWIPPINSRSCSQIEQNEQALILYPTNRSIKGSEISPYFIYKHSNDSPYQSGGKTGAVRDNGDSGDEYTLGTRVAQEFGQHFKARAEGAYQFGTRENRAELVHPNDIDVSAWAFNSQVSYHFNDALKNVLKLQCEHLSGDNPGSATNEQFDPLWGRWPQWSEYYIYTFATETRIAETTNFWRLGGGWDVKPTSKLTLGAMYHVIWSDNNTLAGRPGFSTTGNLRGQLITGVIRYNFNRFFAAHLIGEYFFTGNYYDSFGARNDADGAYARVELTATF